MPKRLKPVLTLGRDYAILLAGAVIMGVVVAGFAIATDKAQEIFAALSHHIKLLPLVISPAIFAVSLWVVLRYFPAASGSGVPQSIAAQHVTSQADRQHLLGFPVAVAKFLLVLLALLGGASLGREGPSVQIGAAIMLLFADITRVPDKRTFITAGAAAGLAAAFNTPITGIAFLLEDMLKGKPFKDRLTMLAIILLSGVAAIAVTGSYDYYGHIQPEMDLNKLWLPVIVVGVICGLSGSVFNIFITRGRKHICRMFGGFGGKRPVAFAALCGFAVAMLGISSGGVTFGSGYEIGHDLLHGVTAPAWWHPFAKIAATAISVISGIPGGTISPSLSIGATIGGALTPLFPGTPVAVIVLLAIAGYFAAFTQSPITAAVIVLEISGKATAVIPLLAVAIIAAAVSRALFPQSIFDLLADTIVADLHKHKKKDDISHYDA
ncbi:MAG: chloride channel protein [Alphaproteobacteria bacterium]|nr:MAG: chloride channel protein [Alphaproteobacteria bacterium]